MSTWTTQKLADSTPETEVWAAANLDGLATKFQLSNKTKVELHNDDGKMFRHAFNIVVAPDRGNPYFKVWLFIGATEADKLRARAFVGYAQQGHFSTKQWRHIPPSDAFPYSRYVFDLWVGFDPSRASNELRACTVTGCVDGMHAWQGDVQDDPCRTEGIEHTGGHYTVRGWRFFGEEWTADATHDSDCFPEGPAGLEVIRDLANDFAWVQQDCERLNEGSRHEHNGA